MYGDHVHAAVLAAKETRSGCTVHFVDDRGNRIHRHHLAIESLAVLPMRRMLLLGCEDGHVRVTA